MKVKDIKPVYVKRKTMAFDVSFKDTENVNRYYFSIIEKNWQLENFHIVMKDRAVVSESKMENEKKKKLFDYFKNKSKIKHYLKGGIDDDSRSRQIHQSADTQPDL